MIMILAVLLVVMIANSFVRYLTDAASGTMSIFVVMKIVALTLPRLVAFILPISLFLAILFVYGKLFANSELLVMMACGLSWKRLMKITLGPTLVVVVVTAVIMLWVQPLMKFYQDSLHNSANKQAVSLIQAGQFIGLNQGKQIVYIGEHTKNNEKVAKVFLFVRGSGGKPMKIVKAPYGYQHKDLKTGKNYMVLENGYQYQVHKGQLNYNITHFKDYAIQIEGQGVVASSRGVKSQSTVQLFHSHTLAAKSELSWRFAIPIAAFVLAILAVGLSYVEPRQGRFGKILPAILVFIIYFNILTAARSWLQNGTTPAYLGLWWVHAIFLIIGLFILFYRDGKLWGRKAS